MWRRRLSQNVVTKNSLHGSTISIDANNMRGTENIDDSRSFSKDSRFTNNLNFEMTFSNKYKSNSKELEIREAELESDPSSKQINPFEISNFDSLIAKNNRSSVSIDCITNCRRKRSQRRRAVMRSSAVVTLIKTLLRLSSA
jgi:hypothetical protein